VSSKKREGKRRKWEEKGRKRRKNRRVEELDHMGQENFVLQKLERLRRKNRRVEKNGKKSLSYGYLSSGSKD
jgi:hypothetical protein